MAQMEYKKDLKEKLIIYRKSLNLPKNITFGIEIEYENILKDIITYALEEEKDLLDWKNTREIDILEYNEIGDELNGEIVSPILTDNPKTWNNLKNVCNILDRKGALVTRKCGGHVNIGAHILGNNPKYWRNFFLLWILYEKEIYKFSSGEFARIRVELDNFIDTITLDMNINDVINIKNKTYLASLNNCIFDKCHDFYISSSSPNKKMDLNNRIEFRIPNGTLKEEIWQNYINFFAKFLIACKKDLDVDKVLYKIENKQHNPIELADYVFNDEIDKDMFLIQTLKTNKVYKKEMPSHKYYFNTSL